MSYVRRCLLSINKIRKTKIRERDVEKNNAMTPQFALDANQLSGLDEEIRICNCNNNKTVNKEVSTLLHENDADTMDILQHAKSDVTKKNFAALNETEYSKVFQRKEVFASKFIIIRSILKTIPEESL